MESARFLTPRASQFATRHPMGENNARLIAAAPQLADAVAAALELLTNPDAEAPDADRITHQLREVLKRLEVQ